MSTIKNIIVIILAVVFFAFGSGITICKMACSESGIVQLSINEQESCCDENQEDACCDEKPCSDKMGCCTHTDNLLQLDQYIPGDKIFLSELNQQIYTATFFSSKNTYCNSLLSNIQYEAPPPLAVENFSSFTHLLRI